MKGRAIRLLDNKEVLKKLHEFLVVIGTFGGIGSMVLLTLAGANSVISKRFLLNGIVITGIILFICIKQIDKHFDGQEWK